MKKAGITVALLMLMFLSYPMVVLAQQNVTEAAIKVLPKTLRVSLTFPGSEQDSVIFKTINEAGQPDYHKNISQLEASIKNSKQLVVKQLNEQEWVVFNNKQKFTLTYTVTSPKKTFMGEKEGENFHPTLFEDFVFAWGNFLLVPHDKVLSSQKVKLTVYAKAYPKFFVSAKTFPSFNDFVNVLLIGGDVRHYENRLIGISIHYIMHGSFAFPDTAFIRAVSKVLEAQIRYMGINIQRQPLLVTLTEGNADNSGGTVVRNAISVYPDKSKPLEANKYDIIRLIAHENFHLWNGQDAIASDPATPEGYYKWFSEGFTEYYANLTLYREHMYSNEDFIDWVNQAIRKYESNPYSLTATPERMKTEYWTNSSVRNVAYNRGALLALLFDLKIKQMTDGHKSLDDLMQMMMKKSREKPFVDSDIIASLQELTQQDWSKFYADHVLGTTPLPFKQVFDDAQLLSATGAQAVFDLGFSTELGGLGLNDVVASVAVGSSAEKAGMLAGDVLKGFSFKWDNVNDDAVFIVERQGKRTKLIYRPVKQTRILQLAETENVTGIQILRNGPQQ
ncbi:M61 family metallopeptidase [Pontibacter cellulosilyticus]|uniref:Uncharacterized protein n=1 Tax=Pontibacter cellulosilyticus TaxID=1720253 RepID=A0A923N719_9BACT|nr:M1 family aminopeptidase [Pontibacter cellulosilyticus]MBC5992087.1 hypothetical protein [Pontibacter cellulosilyticus]